MSIERTIKTVLVSIGSKRGYSRWQYRVVECRADQRGHLSERGVRVLWRSSPLYRPSTKSGRGKGPETRKTAEMVRQQELAKALGI
jgi:hypothetical protein